MIKRATILAVLFSLIACQSPNDLDMTQLSPEERKSVASLAWLKQANVEQDVESALAKNDHRLLVMAGRPPSLPGVPPELASKAKTVCDVRYLEGSTDVIQGDIHLKLIQAAYDYAAAYNQELIKHCLEKIESK